MTDYTKIYDDQFFRERNAATRYSAEKVLEIVANVIPEIKSATDVGCGVGTWLSVLSDRGVDVVRGFDGHWVNQELLEVSKESFVESDLQHALQCNERFDLAISLEVAEHLPAKCADTFVESLTRLSDFVLFSAAIPFQGGVNHLNEQWQSYWAEKFESQDYVPTDPVRPRIWRDAKISIPYRQNMILYVSRKRIREISSPVCEIPFLSVAHPEMYEIRNSKSIKQSLRDLCMTTTARGKRMLGLK